MVVPRLKIIARLQPEDYQRNDTGDDDYCRDEKKPVSFTNNINHVSLRRELKFSSCRYSPFGSGMSLSL